MVQHALAGETREGLWESNSCPRTEDCALVLGSRHNSTITINHRRRKRGGGVREEGVSGRSFHPCLQSLQSVDASGSIFPSNPSTHTQPVESRGQTLVRDGF